MMKRLQFMLSFNGRISRGPFLYYNLAVSAGSLLVNFIPDREHIFTSRHPAVILYGLVFLWPSLAVAVKRFHDIGKNGWHLLLVLIPFLGPLWVALDLLLTPSTAEPNQFGPVPARTNGSVHEYTRPNTSPYFLEIALFGMLPLGLLWVMRVSLQSGNTSGTITVLALLAVLAGVFMVVRRRYFIKVLVSDEGLTLQGLMRSVSVPWTQVQTVDVNEDSFQGAVEIRTAADRFVLPGLMRRRSEAFPKLERSTEGESWVFSDGTRLPVEVRNGPLYRELKERVSPNRVAGSD